MRGGRRDYRRPFRFFRAVMARRDGQVKRAWRVLAVAATLAGPAAAQVPAGGEIDVNTYTTGSQDDAAVAVTRDGRFVVVWESPQDGSGDAVVARAFDRVGHAGRRRVPRQHRQQRQPGRRQRGRGPRRPVRGGVGEPGRLRRRHLRPALRRHRRAHGGEFRVNTFDRVPNTRPRWPCSRSRGFVVTWSVFELPGPAPDGSNGAVMARRFDATGAPRGDEFVVNTYTPGLQNFGYAASSANGTFVIIWQTRELADSGYDIFGQRYDDAGNRLGGEFQVNRRPPATSSATRRPWATTAASWCCGWGRTATATASSAGGSTRRERPWAATSSSTPTPRATRPWPRRPPTRASTSWWPGTASTRTATAGASLASASTPPAPAEATSSR